METEDPKTYAEVHFSQEDLQTATAFESYLHGADFDPDNNPLLSPDLGRTVLITAQVAAASGIDAGGSPESALYENGQPRTNEALSADPQSVLAELQRYFQKGYLRVTPPAVQPAEAALNEARVRVVPQALREAFGSGEDVKAVADAQLRYENALAAKSAWDKTQARVRSVMGVLGVKE